MRGEVEESRGLGEAWGGGAGALGGGCTALKRDKRFGTPLPNQRPLSPPEGVQGQLLEEG